MERMNLHNGRLGCAFADVAVEAKFVAQSFPLRGLVVTHVEYKFLLPVL